MNELIQSLVHKVGISEDQAKRAAETVLGFLKQKLPASVSSQLDGVLGTTGSFGEAAKKAGGGLGST
ncbi:MAG: hypothetical protein ACRD5F_04350 [Candidatus Acidiferrales bacterium]